MGETPSTLPHWGNFAPLARNLGVGEGYKNKKLVQKLAAAAQHMPLWQRSTCPFSSMAPQALCESPHATALLWQCSTPSPLRVSVRCGTALAAQHSKPFGSLHMPWCHFGSVALRALCKSPHATALLWQCSTLSPLQVSMCCVKESSQHSCTTYTHTVICVGVVSLNEQSVACSNLVSETQ